MKKLLSVVSFAALLISSVGQAYGGPTISRGGLGFLFPDHNSFVNPGQFALDKGTAVDMSYTTQTNSGTTDQSLTPSVVYGGGNFGFGVDVTRTGTSLTNTAEKSDSVGAGMGVALDHEHITVGVAASRSIDVNQTNDGIVGGTLTWNGDKRMGFTTGVAVNTTINQAGGNTQTGTAAVGWGFNQMTRVEVDATFNNLNNFSDYDLGAFITMQGNMLYAAAGYNYLMLAAESQLQGRLGLTFGRFDISGYVSDTLNSGDGVEFGGAVRLAF